MKKNFNAKLCSIDEEHICPGDNCKVNKNIVKSFDDTLLHVKVPDLLGRKKIEKKEK